MAIENKNVYQHESNCDVDCDEYVKTDCVIHTGAIAYLGLEAGASTTEILLKLVQTVEYLQAQINTINNP